MPDLIIEYVLDNKHPGYAFQPSTNGYSDAVLKTVWRQAIPRGQGWGAEVYRGAYALKCFGIDARAVALSEALVTDQIDEMGRKGIRRAHIHLVPPTELSRALKERLAAYPEHAQRDSQQRLTLGLWKQIVDNALPRVRGGPPQIVLAHRYIDRGQWRMVEALVLRLVTAWPLHVIPGWGQVNSFTTLALSAHDESRIVALPLERARQMNGLRIVEIPE